MEQSLTEARIREIVREEVDSVFDEIAEHVLAALGD